MDYLFFSPPIWASGVKFNQAPQISKDEIKKKVHSHIAKHSFHYQ